MSAERRRKRREFRPYLFPECEDQSAESRRDIIPADFGTHRLRLVWHKGAWWWVLSDVARVLGYTRGRDAARLLRPHQKGAHELRTPGGVQNVAIVSEGGLFRLIMKSQHPIAEQFQDWVTDDVLPEIRRTGTYNPRSKRIARKQRKLGCDIMTAMARCDNEDCNKALVRDIVSRGAGTNEIIQVHRATTKAQVGKYPAEICKDLGFRRDWLEHSSGVVISQNTHIKNMAELKIRDSDRKLTFDEEIALREQMARDITKDDFDRLGPEYAFGIDDHPTRGNILDIQRIQLEG